MRLTGLGVISVGLGLLAGLTLSGTAEAKAGFRGTSISTWDTRASSVALTSTAFAAEGRVFNALSYNTNFSSTSGNLSSQFGLHYLTLWGEERVDLFPDDGIEPGALQGFSASAMTLLGRPLLPRHPNGLPRLAWGAYFGLIPSALVGGDVNYVNIPLVMGLGVPFSPTPWLTLTPWAEAELAFNLDTYLLPDAVDLDQLTSQEEATVSDVISILGEAVAVDYGPSVTGRGGLAVAAHLGNRLDLGLTFTLASLGAGQGNQLAAGGGLSLVFHWDRVVPAALPMTP